MPEQMQQYAIHLCEEAMDRCTLEKDVAAHLKKEMDKRYGPTWHCIVGRNFGSTLGTTSPKRIVLRRHHDLADDASTRRNAFSS
ncbi:dynein light chain LC8-type [Paragonimus westermani]|uniref:Dynein light chain n=1 Tax=Paragonimus westermani TaxID=34504 RepID=A0A5J4NDF9_9TREM|nr:dynein light chain LC8-type [Paragonimus westermani]